MLQLSQVCKKLKKNLVEENTTLIPVNRKLLALTNVP